MQNEAPSLQVPASHKLEQHWVLSVHGLPAVWQAALSGLHRPALQLPPQQEAESTHAWLSPMHALALQRPAVQASEQHSVDEAQPPPVAVHLLIEATQVVVEGSQIPEQQSPPEAQVWPKARQNGEGVESPTLVRTSAGAALPSTGGYLPTLAVLLHATSAKANASRETALLVVGRIEPDCSSTSGCTSKCGDGIVLNEDCDDGNAGSGDGCSKDCKVEPGWICTQPTLGDNMKVP